MFGVAEPKQLRAELDTNSSSENQLKWRHFRVRRLAATSRIRCSTQAGYLACLTINKHRTDNVSPETKTPSDN